MQDRHPRQRLKCGRSKKYTCWILFSSPLEGCKTAEKTMSPTVFGPWMDLLKLICILFALFAYNFVSSFSNHRTSFLNSFYKRFMLII